MKFIEGQSEFVRPQILLAPDGKPGGGATTSDAKNFDSTLGFERLPFYIALNKEALAFLPDGITNHLDIGAGAGAVPVWTAQLGKYAPNYRVTLVEPTQSELAKAEDRFRTDAARFTFIQAWAEDFEVPAESFDVVTAMNSIHLYIDVEEFFRRAHRAMKPGAVGLANSAYIKNVAFPETILLLQWGREITFTKDYLRANHGITDFAAIDNPLKYEDTQIVDMAVAGGFNKEDITVVRNTIRIPEDQAQDLVSVKEFVDGAIPGVDEDKAREALRAAIPEVIKKTRKDAMYRGWATFVFKKAA